MLSYVQVNRLKYYYAVAEFDSEETASRVYSECDGMEYELSATRCLHQLDRSASEALNFTLHNLTIRFDLRYIPDDMTFSTPATDSCTATPDPSKYQPKIFQTTALQQQKVNIHRLDLTNHSYISWNSPGMTLIQTGGKAMKRAFEVTLTCEYASG